MAEDEDYRPKNLSNNRTIEDQQRDDIIALTYMNSQKFGQGIDVSGSAKRVVNDPQESDVQIAAPPQDAPPESQTVEVVNPGDDMQVAPQQYAERLQHISVLPPEEPLPNTEDFGVGDFNAVVGGGVPEAPPPDPPILAAMPMDDVSLDEEVFIPASTQLVQLPQPAQSLEPTPEPPPLDPSSIRIEKVEPIPEREEEEPPAMPWLQEPEFRVAPAYEKDGVQSRIEEFTPESMSIEAMDSFARSHTEYIETITGILIAISERIDEAISRIRELESVNDRRYRRRYF